MVLLFAVSASALIVIPGPNMIYIVTRTIDQGRRAGVASAFGVETGTLVHVVLAVVGISTLIAASPVAFTVVRYLGAAYLCYLGVQALRRRPPADLPEGDRPPRTLRQSFTDGLVVNVLNPKVGLFFLAFLPQFVDADRGPAALQTLVLGVVFFLIALALDLGYAFGSAALRGWLNRRSRLLRRQNQIAGGVYLTLGVAAALTGGQSA
ncbi:RhtB family transporter [Spirilliplanes yamanashiensis]|uniref:RhtB family transporter n=2 Tax=Spirilliplanes yamanashiensis TaxID=42233 RepID=A0A8J4DIF1_9ACTN|nr:RhtB family transporter [Spirilliplanes yamanashiensis]